MAALFAIAINGNETQVFKVKELTDQDLEELDYEGCTRVAKEWAEERGYSYVAFMQEWDEEEEHDEDFISINVNMDELLKALPKTQ